MGHGFVRPGAGVVATTVPGVTGVTSAWRRTCGDERRSILAAVPRVDVNDDGTGVSSRRDPDVRVRPAPPPCGHDVRVHRCVSDPVPRSRVLADAPAVLRLACAAAVAGRVQRENGPTDGGECRRVPCGGGVEDAVEARHAPRHDSRDRFFFDSSRTFSRCFLDSPRILPGRTKDRTVPRHEFPHHGRAPGRGPSKPSGRLLPCQPGFPILDGPLRESAAPDGKVHVGRPGFDPGTHLLPQFLVLHLLRQKVVETSSGEERGVPERLPCVERAGSAPLAQAFPFGGVLATRLRDRRLRNRAPLDEFGQRQPSLLAFRHVTNRAPA